MKFSYIYIYMFQNCLLKTFDHSRSCIVANIKNKQKNALYIK